jgi:betaine-aldehyde dehydrogenase
MGPVASEAQLERVMRYIQLGSDSARLVTGGRRLGGDPFGNGYFLAPTVFTDIEQDSPLVQDEIFGPVLVVQTFTEEDDAIALANGTAYGLAAGVWTSDVDRALRVSRRLRAGTVWVNSYNRLAPEVETGGYKESGIGRASGIEGIREYTEIKNIHLEFALAPGQ